MTETSPVLEQVNLVVKDMDAAVDFYRLLGVEIPDTDADWQAHHRTAKMHRGLDFDLDSQAFAPRWNAGWRSSGPSGSIVLTFRVPTREAVDALYQRVTNAGYATQQAPFDAFWGARYAIVEDPDGNAVGIMSPSDPERRTAPTPP